MPAVELLALERVRLEVEQREPDPHRRQHLDQGQPPVGEQRPQPLEEHHERAEREDERREDPPRPAQREDGCLDRGLVVLPDRVQERARLPHDQLASRLGRVVAARLLCSVGAHSLAARPFSSARHANQTGEKTAQTSDSVTMTKR